MEILKTNLEDFKNIENWEYKENFHTVNSRHGDIIFTMWMKIQIRMKPYF